MTECKGGKRLGGRKEVPGNPRVTSPCRRRLNCNSLLHYFPQADVIENHKAGGSGQEKFTLPHLDRLEVKAKIEVGLSAGCQGTPSFSAHI